MFIFVKLIFNCNSYICNIHAYSLGIIFVLYAYVQIMLEDDMYMLLRYALKLHVCLLI